MSVRHHDTIRMLQIGGDVIADAAEWRRKAARVAWVRETVAALREAHRKVDEAWDRIFDARPDELGDERSAQSCRGHDEHWSLEAIPDPPEQAELDAIHAQLRAVIDEDRWPRELYFGGI